MDESQTSGESSVCHGGSRSRGGGSGSDNQRGSLPLKELFEAFMC
ncbi:unnamed protein product [Spirodela intermedia]|uniref:Uncharacterized protein n=1 Tax=Spirodela intermedia TaxID=51605 RepID=A0A7I8JE17_SPIIN|nr:unnamed protein product [Spirodela intermedia]CAA6667783.1 unnamed protein product [Spirodela intermedia]